MKAVDGAFQSAQLKAEDVEAARVRASVDGRRLVEVLEEQSGLAPDDFSAALARALQYPWLGNQRLHRLQPAFEILPFPEAAAHGCLLLHADGGELLLAIGDPFASDFEAWACERIGAPFRCCLAHRDDIAAYLGRLEDDLRAMDQVSTVDTDGADPGQQVEDLSIRAINESASPVIRLVNSTLHDALKAGASDIHLESGGTGLTIKYRIDGVLD